MGMYSKASYSGAMGIMSKQTEWNGIISFLIQLKSGKDQETTEPQDISSITSCPRQLLSACAKYWNLGFRATAGNPTVGNYTGTEIRQKSEIGRQSVNFGNHPRVEIGNRIPNNMIVCV